MGKLKLIFVKKLMQIFVKTLTGKTVTLEVEAETTVADIKEQICLEEGIQFNHQKLIIGGKLIVENAHTVEKLELEENQTLDLVVVPVVPLPQWIQQLMSCPRN